MKVYKDKTLRYVSFHDMNIVDVSIQRKKLQLEFRGVYCLLNNNGKIGWFVAKSNQRLVFRNTEFSKWVSYTEGVFEKLDFSNLRGEVFLELVIEKERVILKTTMGEIHFKCLDIYAEISLSNLYLYRFLDEKEKDKDVLDAPETNLIFRKFS